MKVSDVVDAFNNGQFLTRSFHKTPTQTTAQGIWYDLSMAPGTPPAQYYSSTILTASALYQSTDGGINHGPNPPSGYYKYMNKILLQTGSATAAPLSVQFMDYLAYYPGIPMDTGSQSLTTNITIPRQTNGRGIQMMLIEQFPYAASPQAQGFVTYVNQDGNTSVTPTFTCNTQVTFGTVATSAVSTAGAVGRFLSLASGDSGVRYPTSIEFTVGDIGVCALVLVNPLFWCNLLTFSAFSA